MIDNAEVYLNQSWSAVVQRWDCDTEEGFGKLRDRKYEYGK